MCSECRDFVFAIRQFRHKCVWSERALHNFFTNAKTLINEETNWLACNEPGDNEINLEKADEYKCSNFEFLILVRDCVLYYSLRS